MTTDRSSISSYETPCVKRSSRTGAITAGLLFLAAIGLKAWAMFTAAQLYMNDQPTEWLRPFDTLFIVLIALAAFVAVVFGVGTRLANRRNGV